MNNKEKLQAMLSSKKKKQAATDSETNSVEETPTQPSQKVSGLSDAEVQRILRGVKVGLKKLAVLKPADYNPRVMTKEQREGLKASLQEFGLVETLVWNKRTGNLVGGHQRVRALLDMGVPEDAEVNVTIVDLDAAHEKALNVTLNNQNIQGLFDPQALGPLLEGLDTTMPQIVFDELRLAELAAAFVFKDETEPLDNGRQAAHKQQQGPPTLDEIATQHGSMDDPTTMWRGVHLHVSPKTASEFTAMFDALPGEDDEDKVQALLEKLR